MLISVKLRSWVIIFFRGGSVRPGASLNRRPVEPGSGPLNLNTYKEAVFRPRTQWFPTLRGKALWDRSIRKLIEPCADVKETAFQRGEKSMRHPSLTISLHPTTADEQA
jgi:hypothetical protein